MRSLSSSRRALASASAVALAAASVILLPASASAAVADAPCVVTDATLTWGVKESYRSYISGSFAGGSWETVDGATYETPVFSWTDAEGAVDGEGSGSIAFTGGILFTGHEGVMRTLLSSPRIELDGDDAALILDVYGTDRDAALAGDETEHRSEGVRFVEIDASEREVAVDGDVVTITVTDAPTVTTEDAYAAFPYYQPDTAFDPISFTLTAECPSGVLAAAEVESASCMPWAVAGGAVAVVAVAGGVLVARRRSAGRS